MLILIFSSSCSGGIVALGKFDALHIGHRELAIQVSKSGIPYLLSFVGMAEVFGWEPRYREFSFIFPSFSSFNGSIFTRVFKLPVEMDLAAYSKKENEQQIS